MSRRILTWSRAAAASFTAAVALVAGGLATTGAPAFAGGSAATSGVRMITSVRPLAYTPKAKPATGAQPSAAGLKIWSRTVNDGGSSFTYRMVGKDPFTAQSAPSTTVTVPLVPLVIKFGGFTWDPTTGDSCDATSALTRTLNSPVVKPLTWSFGGTSVGKAQYVDAFQRANYYSQTKPTGINPGYHVKLKFVTRPAVVVNVPLADAATATISCGNGRLAAVDIDWLDNYLQTVAVPAVNAAGFGAKTFPLFLVGNVVEYIGSPSQCCVLGFHNALSTASSAQTYSISMYDSSGAFSGLGDVEVLSHEVAEWLADPFTDNPTKPWGNIGQVGGCQTNLEVGDPLTGTFTTVTTGGMTYHLEDLAFTSWFYHQTPSTGVNGWYSVLGTFRSPAAVC